jgi:hypothetical protein
MPKSKPDIVHSVRIELQETERATLEAALAGRFVTNAAMAGGNLLKGVGAALAPFQGALTALAAVWIAEKTVEEIAEVIENTKEHIELFYNSSVQGDGVYGDHVAWLNVNYANSGFDKLPVSPNPAKLTTDQWDSWAAHVKTMGDKWGPFDAVMLLKITAKAIKWGMGDGLYISQRTGTPGEWFTREITIEDWQAWQTAFNARRS